MGDFTELDLMVVASWSKKELWRYCKKETENLGHTQAVINLLKFRRELQGALEKYAKGKGVADGIQHKAIWATEMVLRWCGDYYKEWALREVIKSHPTVKMSPQKLKGLTNQSWEVFLRQHSY